MKSHNISVDNVPHPACNCKCSLWFLLRHAHSMAHVVGEHLQSHPSLPPSLPPPRPPRNIHKSVLSLTSDHKYLKHMKSVSRRTRGWLKWASFYCLPFPLHHSVILRPFSSCEEIHRTLKQCCWPWTAFDGVSAWWNKTQQWLSGLFLFSIYTS